MQDEVETLLRDLGVQTAADRIVIATDDATQALEKACAKMGVEVRRKFDDKTVVRNDVFAQNVVSRHYAGLGV